MAPPASRSKPADADGKRLYEMLEGYASDGRITPDEAEKAVKASKTWGKINPKARHGVDRFFLDYCPAGLKLDAGVQDKFVKGLGLGAETFKKCTQGGGAQTTAPSGSKKKNPWAKKTPQTPTTPTTPAPPTPTPEPEKTPPQEEKKEPVVPTEETPEPQPTSEEAYLMNVMHTLGQISKAYYMNLLKQDPNYLFTVDMKILIRIDASGQVLSAKVSEIVITKLPEEKRVNKGTEDYFRKDFDKRLENWAAQKKFPKPLTGKKIAIEVPIFMKPTQ